VARLGEDDPLGLGFGFCVEAQRVGFVFGLVVSFFSIKNQVGRKEKERDGMREARKRVVKTFTLRARRGSFWQVTLLLIAAQ
jgi:hypothetical protein